MGRHKLLRFKPLMKGQASIENMLMFGFGLLIATMFFVSAYVMLSDSIISAQAKSAADLLGKEADYTRALGPGTVRHVDFYLPSGTTALNISGNTVLVMASDSAGNEYAYEVTAGNVSGNVSIIAGMKRVEMRTLDSGIVQITETG